MEGKAGTKWCLVAEFGSQLVVLLRAYGVTHLAIHGRQIPVRDAQRISLDPLAFDGILDHFHACTRHANGGVVAFAMPITDAHPDQSITLK